MTELPKLGRPATRALATIGVTSLEHVAEQSEKELLKLHGFGPKAIETLKPVLAAQGLTFRPD